jgi:8-oxo-dGTP pyrophosphatase MutT (NUDIX family)
VSPIHRGPSHDDGGFQQLGERALHEGAVIRLVEGSFAAPDGTVFERDIVRHPGAVAVVPLDARGHVTLVRQFRAALDQLVIEIPAGKRDVAGEPPEVTAGRELVEEVGLSAGSLELLTTFHNSVGFSDEACAVYLATDLSPAEMARDGIEERYLEVLHLPLGDAVQLVEDGVVTDAKTVIGLLLARDRTASSSWP